MISDVHYVSDCDILHSKDETQTLKRTTVRRHSQRKTAVCRVSSLEISGWIWTAGTRQHTFAPGEEEPPQPSWFVAAVVVAAIMGAVIIYHRSQGEPSNASGDIEEWGHSERRGDRQRLPELYEYGAKDPPHILRYCAAPNCFTVMIGICLMKVICSVHGCNQGFHCRATSPSNLQSRSGEHLYILLKAIREIRLIVAPSSSSLPYLNKPFTPKNQGGPTHQWVGFNNLRIEKELDTKIYPGTEIMTDVGSHHFVKSSKRSDRVLVPQPSNNPSDPLNWSPFWKATAMFLSTAVTFTQAFGPLALAPMFPQLIRDFDTDLAGAVKFTGVCILVLGFSNFFWVPLQTCFGRRPVLILSTLVCLVASIWRGLATSYGSFMGACILNGFGAGPAETAQPQIIADIMFLHERGAYNTLYFTFYFGALVMSPVISGSMAYNLHWRDFWWLNIIVIIGYTAIGIQVAALPAISSTYAVDSYKPIAGSIFVTITVNKNLWGYGLSEFITPWTQRSGFIPAIMLNMCLTTLFCACGTIFYYYGKRLRKITANSKVHRM
ncbi:MFS transporter [Histoplasma capsulatum H143]|uniref:MFS transporter n=1 Tax=Ajellomyces capsulatus (strain H143) TaxID=544712 RepID=C6H7L9_AJECH|nr:MFS transporter [Histoplasma capsulatum H143]